MYYIFKQSEELTRTSQHAFEVHSHILFVYLSIGAHFTLQNVHKPHIPARNQTKHSELLI